MMRRRMLPAVVLVLTLVGGVALAGGAPASRVEVRPLKAPAPSWWTPELASRVRAAGPAGVPVPAQAKIPTSSAVFTGIRPGSLIILDDGSSTALCTTNFVFANTTALGGFLGLGAAPRATAAAKPSGRTVRAAAPEVAIGTAGHCGTRGTDVFMVFAPVGLAKIGTITSSTGDPGNRLSPDFALITISPAFHQYVSPSMAYWGGPTGAYVPPTPSTVAPLLHAGWGLVVGTGGTPRAAVAYKWGQEYRFQGAVTPGDSGSGAIVAGGLAAGNITHIAVDTRQQVPVWNGGTSIAKILTMVGTLRLATCSRPIPWPLPGCPPV